MQNEHFETAGLAGPAPETDLKTFSSAPTLGSRTTEVSDTGRPNGNLRDERAEWQVLFEHMRHGRAHTSIALYHRRYAARAARITTNSGVVSAAT